MQRTFSSDSAAGTHRTSRKEQRMPQHDWSKFVRRVTINASPQQIYDAWTRQEQIERWFLRKAEFAQADGTGRRRTDPIQIGDSYVWLWYGYSDDVVEKGKVLEANGKDLLTFTFTAGCNVTVTVREERGENIAELTQEQIPFREDPNENLHLLCSNGWTFYLANLKSVLEGGIDLRNKNVEIPNVINA